MKTIIKEELSQKTLKELLYYDELTGIFTWKHRPISMFSHCINPQGICNMWNSRFANKEAGCIWTAKIRKTSYLSVIITLNGETKRYYAHRLAILYTDGRFPAEDVDHLDGNGLNNRRNNLREVSHGENLKNQSMYSNNTSGTVGVCWHKQRQKWIVQISVDGKQIHGGCFTNLEDAITKRKQMEIEYGFHINHGRD